MNRGLNIGGGSRLGGLGAFGVKGGGVGGDTTPPTIIISSSESSPSFANPIPLIFTLSEPSTDFAIGDITVSVTGTSLGNFAGSGANYTADLTITGAAITALVDVSAGTFHDSAGNANLPATQFNITSSILMRDDFTTPVTAPMTSPRLSVPGPGSLTITNVTGTSIGAGEVRFAVGNAIVGSTILYARKPGRAVFIKPKTLANGYAGWFRGLSSFNIASGLRVSAGVYSRNSHLADVGASTIVTNTPWSVILRSTGSFAIMNQTLLWVDNAETDTPLTPAMQTFADGTTGSADYMYVADMSSPWNTDFGIATNHIVSAPSGTTTTSEANALVEITWQAITGTGQIWNLYTRWVDDNNCWATRVAMDTSTIKLIEITNGTGTERASAAQTFVNGTKYRLMVTQDGNTIRQYVDVNLKNTYISGSFNNAETGIKIDHAGTDLTTWPRTISGQALTELSKFINP